MRFELAILNSLQNLSEHILQLVGYCEEPQLTIVTRFYSNGTLHSIIHNRTVFVDDRFIMDMATGIARGMEIIHAKNIVHYDLKPLNILLDDNCQAVISDFGVSNVVSNSAETSERLVAGLSNPHAGDANRFTTCK